MNEVRSSLIITFLLAVLAGGCNDVAIPSSSFDGAVRDSTARDTAVDQRRDVQVTDLTVDTTIDGGTDMAVDGLGADTQPDATADLPCIPQGETPFDGIDSDCDGFDTQRVVGPPLVPEGAFAVASDGTDQLIAWQVSGANRELSMALFNGTSLSPTTAVATSTATMQDMVPAIAQTSTGWYLTWVDHAASPTAVHAYEVNAAGSAVVGNQQTLATFGSSTIGGMRAAASGDGDRAVVLRRTLPAGSDGNAFIYSKVGGTVDIVSENMGEDPPFPDVVALGTTAMGRMLFVPSIDRVRFGIYNDQTTGVNFDDVALGDIGEGKQVRGALLGGTLMVVWTDASGVSQDIAFNVATATGGGSSFSTANAGILIGSSAEEDSPRIAACGSNFHLVHVRVAGVPVVRYRRMDSAGTLIGSERILFDVPNPARVTHLELVCAGADLRLFFRGKDSDGTQILGVTTISP